MRIAVIGNGNVGSGLALALGRAGHEVTTIGRSDDLSAAVSSAELVVLATPYGALAELAGKADFIGKTVIDVSNSVTEDFSGLQVRHKTSAAEEIASLRAGATMVKAFNTIFAKNYGKGLKVNGQPIRAFVAADDDAARGTVKTLAADIGLEPVDAGPLVNARYLDPIGFLNIQFGYVFGHGTEIAPRWQFS